MPCSCVKPPGRRKGRAPRLESQPLVPTVPFCLLQFTYDQVGHAPASLRHPTHVQYEPSSTDAPPRVAGHQREATLMILALSLEASGPRTCRHKVGQRPSTPGLLPKPSLHPVCSDRRQSAFPSWHGQPMSNPH